MFLPRQRVNLIWSSCRLIALIHLVSSAALTEYLKNLVKELPFSSSEELLYSGLAREPKLRIVEGPLSQEVNTGEQLRLTCESYGSPAPTMHWLKDGVRIGEQENVDDDNGLERLTNFGHKTYQESATKSELVIHCATPADSGLYTCVARNGLQTKSSQADVEVFEDSGNYLRIIEDIDADCVQEGQAARIQMWSDFRLERSGVNVQLYCRASGSPPPRVYWVDFDDEILRDGDLYQNLPNGDLMIKNIHRDRANDGIFRCIASNKYGDDVKETFVLPLKYDGEDDAGAEVAEPRVAAFRHGRR